MTTTVFILIVAVLFIIGVPVYVALGLGSALFVMFSDGIAGHIILRRFLTGVDSTALLCVPFFILAGDLMASGGIAPRLIELCKMLVGKFRGGLTFVCIFACTFFAAVTGSAIACTVALGAILIPAMLKEGYSRSFATACVSAGSVLGPIIPPSIGLILYCEFVSDCSIISIFRASFPAGLFLAVLFCITAYFLCLKKGYKGVQFTPEQQTVSYRLHAVRDGIWALGTPLIILGGIFAGICTPTEAAVLAVLYSLIVGLFIYKDIKFSDLPGIFQNSAKNTARIMIILCSAQLFGWVLQYVRLSNNLVELVSGLALGKNAMFCLIMFIVFILGMFLDGATIIIISTPIFVPIAHSLGIDSVHFGVCYSIMMGLGLMTPPFGTVLYTGSFVGKTPVLTLSKELVPYILVHFISVIILIFCPWIFSWIV